MSKSAPPRKRTPKPRRFKIGDVQGPYEVVGYAGRQASTGYQRTVWLYTAKCLTCGNIHERPQDQFRSNARGCKACSGKHISESLKARAIPANNDTPQEQEDAARNALRAMGWAR